MLPRQPSGRATFPVRISSIVAVTADRHYDACILPVCEFSGVQYVLGCCSGTATISRTVQWTLITDRDTALKLLPPRWSKRSSP